MKSEEELHKLVEKVIDDFAAWDEDERYKEPEKELRQLLEDSKVLGFIMYTRLSDILGWHYRMLTEAKEERTLTAKEEVLLNDMDAVHDLMELTMDEENGTLQKALKLQKNKTTLLKN